LKRLSYFSSSCSILAGVALLIVVPRSAAQAPKQNLPSSASTATTNPSEASPPESSQSEATIDLPDAPGEVSDLEPLARPFAAAKAGGGRQQFDVEPAVTVHTDPFSRVGVGVSVSPLGIGIEPAIVLTQFFDLRLTGNYFQFNPGRIEVDDYNVYPGLHLASGAALVDLYPGNIPIRVSAGLMFYNNNHISAALRFASGSSFTLNGQAYYVPVAGATPLTGTAAVAFHTIRPAPEVTFGWGRFIPRSERHWSFPSEFGVVFSGAPSPSVAVTGTVCTDVAMTMCGDAGSTTNPVGAEFNSALQAKMAMWRRSLNDVKIYPIASGGVSFSFDTPWGWEPTAKAKF
jgi:hypothetical protein